MDSDKKRNLRGPDRQGPIGTHANFVALLALAGCLAGCGDGVQRPTKEQLAAFERTTLMEPVVDMARIERARLSVGPYRVIPGDVLEFTMPALLQSIRAAEVQAAQAPVRDEQPHVCRVDTRGIITLPAVGEISVAGLSLGEIEEKAIEAYRDFVVLQPSIYVRVREYSTSKVYIAGAVENPGVYTLRSDQMTLVSLVTEANGISDSGATAVRIIRSKDQNPTTENAVSERVVDQEMGSAPASIILPVVGMNIPFRDIALDEGDTVLVEPIHAPLFSVLGLVTRPNNFEYPPTVEYNLAQAIAFAGGLDPVADPRYATIYRLSKDGSVMRIPLKLVEKDAFTEALSTPIHPGDVVAVERTLRTRINTTIYNLLRVNIGLYITGDDFWNRN